MKEKGGRSLTRHQQQPLSFGLHLRTFPVFFIRAAVERLTGLMNNRLLQVHLAGHSLQKRQSGHLLLTVLKERIVWSPNLHFLPDAEDTGSFGFFCSLTDVLLSHNHLFHARSLHFLQAGGSVRINANTTNETRQLENFQQDFFHHCDLSERDGSCKPLSCPAS